MSRRSHVVISRDGLLAVRTYSILPPPTNFAFTCDDVP